jgi:Fur family iron response transcriptional regulator
MERAGLARVLSEHGIQPSAQRLALAEYVLEAGGHFTANRVLEEVRSRIPMVSRAIIYNTLNLFVRRGLLKQLVLAEGRAVFDAHLERHHHFVDEATGAIHDIPWEALEVRRVEALRGVEVREYQVILRGRWKRAGEPGRGPWSPRADEELPPDAPPRSCARRPPELAPRPQASEEMSAGSEDFSRP